MLLAREFLYLKPNHFQYFIAFYITLSVTVIKCLEILLYDIYTYLSFRCYS